MLSACAQSPSTQNAAVMGNLLLAEPAPASARSQMAIARYNHILSQAELKPEETAELLFQRGTLYDSVGLPGLARYDYTQALKLKPNLAEAYNSIGIHYTQGLEFTRAYEAFDSTLDIKPDYNFALLNRAIALYYGDRAKLALDDIDQFYSLDTDDPYRILWYYIIQKEVDQDAAQGFLRAVLKQVNKQHWAFSLVEYYLGDISEAEVVARLLVDVKSQNELNNRLCEAYFYLGKYQRAQGNQSKAANYFKLALSTNVFEYVEHRYARLELELLRRS